MLLKNTKSNFDFVAFILQSIIAALTISMLTLGLYMASLPIGLQKLKQYGWHKEYGFLTLGMIIIWLLCSLFYKKTNRIQGRHRFFAKPKQKWTLYILLLAMPISGWLISSAAGLPASFFGIFNLPELISANEELRQYFSIAHKWLAYGLIAAIIIQARLVFLKRKS